jgi:membrane-associated phospholipid phosphatase
MTEWLPTAGSQRADCSFVERPLHTIAGTGGRRVGFCLVIAIIGSIDFVWLWQHSVAIARTSLVSWLLLVAYFTGAAWLFRYGRPNFVKSSVARVFAALAQLCATLLVVGPLSYLMISLNLPLTDHSLQWIDDALGFDWRILTSFIVEHPWIAGSLRIAYASIDWQFLIIITICAVNREPREIEFVNNYALSMIVCVVIGGILPAVGEPGLFWPDGPATFAAIRDGHWHLFDYRDMQGIIQFPSFHAAFAIIAIYAVRHKLSVAYGLGILNIFMLVSTPTFGGHYLTDVIGGCLVAGCSILLVNRFQRAALSAAGAGGITGCDRLLRARGLEVPRGFGKSLESG